MSNLVKLRNLMEKYNIHTYIITKADPHQSEYADKRYNGVEFISGFTGSYGYIVVTENEAGLWTDGRYFLQAENKLNKGFTLHKEGEQGTTDFLTYAASITPIGRTIAFCGESLNISQVKFLIARKSPNTVIKFDTNLINEIWDNRPPATREAIIDYPIAYTGQSIIEKLIKVRDHMDKIKGDLYIISSLDDIAWLLNIRSFGGTSTCNFFAYLAITKEETVLFINTITEDEAIITKLNQQGIKISAYAAIYDYIQNSIAKSVIISPKNTNYYLYSRFKDKSVFEISYDITTKLKAKKNNVEIKNIKIANKKDGVAFIKLIMWLKESVKNDSITEYDVVKKMHEIRLENEGYFAPSFDPICGYMKNGAIVHYHVEKSTALTIEPNGFVLVDTGAHYIEGTTDITRTIVVGEITSTMARHYTAVLKGNIALDRLKFIYGTIGTQVDTIARAQLWEEGLNYGHGTGHGIGHLLNVHEGPQNISTKVFNVVLDENMLLSNEPGVYITGEYGIRLENSIFVKKDIKNDHGQFMSFENITFVPFERDAIVVDMLSYQEREWINNYHSQVYNNLEKYLNEQEREWLKVATQEI